LSTVQKTEQFTANFVDIEYVNPLFSKCKVKVLYTGDNRNNSSFTKDVVESALPSIYNIPIVGEFVEKQEDFGGHGGKIEISDDEIKFVQTTKPYGVVPESAEVYWETHEDNGVEHEYLIVDGCYLWTGRYEEAQSVIENGKGQSMEIEVSSGDFNNDDVFEITSFNFSALCILGDETEPCFEGANVTSSFNLNKEDFKNQFNQMIKELKFSLEDQSDKGGEKMGDKFKKVYELSHSDVRSKLYQQLDATLSDNQFSWIVDVYESYFIVEIETLSDEKFDWKFYKYDFNKTEGDEVEISFDSAVEVQEDRNWVEVSQYETLKEQYEQEKKQAVNKAVGEVQTEMTELQGNYQTLEEEVKNLREFKQSKQDEERKESEKELFERFTKALDEEDISDLKEKASDYSLEELETQLYVLVGKKKANFSAPTKKKSDMVKVKVEEDEDVEPKPYGGLVEKYKN